MGYVKNVNPPAGLFPKQGEWLHSRVEVCFHYDTKKKLMGTIVRDDAEEPFVGAIQIDDGPLVLMTECQHSGPLAAALPEQEQGG